MSTSVDINSVAEAIMDSLNEYKSVSDEAVKRAVQKAANDAKNQIRATAPKRTGKHAKQWRVKSDRGGSSSQSTKIIYAGNSPRGYALAHLLENGHATRNGGRTKAYHYIAPAEENAIRELEENIKKALGG